MWIPKKKNEEEKKPKVDEDGFQAVSKGKKVQSTIETKELEVKNGFEVLKQQELIDVMDNTRGEGVPSAANG